jgi:glucose dehydrogenase
MDGRLIVLDGTDGKLCEDFGNRGVVDLTEGLGEFVEHEHVLTSPPAIAGDRGTT